MLAVSKLDHCLLLLLLQKEDCKQPSSQPRPRAQAVLQLMPESGNMVVTDTVHYHCALHFTENLRYTGNFRFTGNFHLTGNFHFTGNFRCAFCTLHYSTLLYSTLQKHYSSHCFYCSSTSWKTMFLAASSSSLPELSRLMANLSWFGLLTLDAAT